MRQQAHRGSVLESSQIGTCRKLGNAAKSLFQVNVHWHTDRQRSDSQTVDNSSDRELNPGSVGRNLDDSSNAAEES